MGVNSEFPQSIKGYEILERLAAGGFGVVYRVKQSSTFGREVAMKVILPKYANQPEFIRRFEAEAEIVARLEHPHIVPLYDYWRDPSGAYLVMRYLKGGNVKDVLEKDGDYELEAASQLLNQVASALEFAHRNNVVHRDIKPGNILIDEDGIAYVADFGIAKDLVKKDGVDTAPESIVGSLDYISPEQARSEPVSGRTDIYSLGVTLYEMLTGEHPFKGFSTIEKLYKHINDPLPDITTLDDEVCDSINAVIHKATSKNPAERYADVLELAHAFREAANLDATEPALSIIERLTMKEHEFLQHLVDGLTVREIAATMFISEAGVKFHRKNAYKKLGVKTRVQAVIKARELDLIYSDTTLDAPSFTSNSDSSIYLPEPINPYKGLQAFQMSDVQDFFGREKFIERLLNKMQEGHDFQRFLAIVGPSGSGKSSLVKAGLLPALLQGKLNDNDKWYVVDMQPNDHPLDRIEVALQRVANEQAENIPQHLSRDERGLVRIADLILPQDETELLIYIDQFEEVFTLCQNEDERQHFLNLLYTAVTAPRSRVRVVITLRADYYDKPLHYHQFGEMLRNRIETILPLGAKELERAIVGPAERVHLQFETGLVAQIVEDMNYQAGALPLLQYALTELFERREGRVLTHAAYQEMGGAVGALANRADEIFEKFSPEQQALAQQMFLRLVTLGEGAEDTRRRATFAELLSIANQNVSVGTANGMSETGVRASDLMEEIIDIFSDYRLLALDHDDQTRQPTVEVAHEAILREWERLREWLNDSRDDIRQERQVAQVAEAWQEHNQDTSYLLRGSRLEQAETWQQETQLSQTPLVNEFVQASIEQRETENRAETERMEREKAQEQRSRILLRALVAIFALAAVTSGGFGLFANNQRIQAEESQQEAKTQSAILLAAQAENEAENGYYDRAILLALETLENYPYTSQAEHALAQAVTYNRVSQIFSGHDGAAISVDWSPDGTRLATSGSDNTVRIWDVETGKELLQLELPKTTGRVLDLALNITWSPNGQKLLTISGDRFVVGSQDFVMFLWDATTGEQLHSFTPSNARENMGLGETGASFVNYPTGNAAAFSPINGQLATISGDNTAVIWDSEMGNPVITLTGHDDSVNGLSWSPDETKIATASEDGTARIWDVATGESLLTISVHEGGANSVAWSPDGLQLLTSGDDGVVRLWDITTEDTVLAIAADEEIVWDATWSDDGTRIITANQDGSVRIWDVVSGREQITLRGHRNWITDIALSPQDEHLASVSFDGEIRIWNVAPSTALMTFPQYGMSGIPPSKWSPSGNQIAFAFENGIDLDGQMMDTQNARIAIVDSRTGEEISVIGSNKWWWMDAKISPDGNSILSNGMDVIFPGGFESAQALNLLDISTGEQIREFTDPEIGLFIRTYDWSPDGSQIIAGDTQGKAYIWDVVTGELIRKFTAFDGWTLSVAWSPDGTKYATGPSQDGVSSIKIWDASTGELLLTLEGHVPPAAIPSLVWSPDSQRLLSVSGEPEQGALDNTVRIWDVNTGEQLLMIDKHTDTVSWGDWSPDGSRIVTTSFDDTTRVWDATRGDELLTLSTSGAWFTYAEWSPDGTRIFVTGNVGTLSTMWHVWQSTEELIDYAYDCCVTRELTPEERQQFGLPER